MFGLWSSFRPRSRAAPASSYTAGVPDWVTISSLATAGGTLVLAVATFASVRSANRAARVAERSLLVGLRPVLAVSRLSDPPEKIGFADDHWVVAPGGHGVAEVTDTAIYLAIALRNAGNGIAVLDGWSLEPDRATTAPSHADPATFRRLTRDIYISAGDNGFWQGALREPTEPLFIATRDAITARKAMAIELLYGDHDGGQRTITRFSLLPARDGSWLATVGRHWNLDRPAPR